MMRSSVSWATPIKLIVMAFVSLALIAMAFVAVAVVLPVMVVAGIALHFYLRRQIRKARQQAPRPSSARPQVIDVEYTVVERG